MAEHAVVIAGGGPTGLMLAAELSLAGTDVAIVERRTSQDLDGSRAGGLHSRTIEVLDQRGVADRFLAAGQKTQIQWFAGTPLDISDFPTRHNYGLALWQREIERILAEWVLGDLAVPIRRGCEVTGFTQDERGIDVALSEGASLRTGYLVGCDGGRSVVRKAADIDFVGWDPTTSWMIAEVDMDEPEVGTRIEGGGIGPVDREAGGGPYRVVLREPEIEHDPEPTLRDLHEALVGAYGTDFGVRNPSWISRFTDTTRQAARYRTGRVLIAGDAAHVHPPQGGQGLNIGLQDAVNLGWKLARVVDGASPETLLDTYHAERHPIGARALQNTMAAVALGEPDDRHQAMRDIFRELLSIDDARRHVAGMLSGLDIHYDLGDEHPLLGRRMPDLDLQTADGPKRVYTLLHNARPVLLALGAPDLVGVEAWTRRVQLVEARYDGRWELPVVGWVSAPAAVLIRPDGYVAWAGDVADPGLRAAMPKWFGAPSG